MYAKESMRVFHFHFDTVKAIQAAGVLIRANNTSSMNFMRLLKLLYIAERESIKETASPIVGGPLYALPRGPILEDVYAMIKDQHRDSPIWAEHFERVNYDVHVVKQPGVADLSSYAVEKLQEIADRYSRFDEWDMVNETHKLSEWRKNDPGESSKRIPLDDVLEAVGLGEHADEIKKDARAAAAADRLFGEHRVQS